MLYFLDTTALVKLLFDETGSRDVQTLCRKPGAIRTTWLCVAETYGILKLAWAEGQRPKERPGRKRLSQTQYDKKLFDMQRYVQTRVKILTDESMNLSLKAFDEIRDLLTTYPRIDFADALHIAALKRQKALNPVFVTADKHLINAAESENVRVWNPEHSDEPTNF